MGNLGIIWALKSKAMKVSSTDALFFCLFWYWNFNKDLFLYFFLLSKQKLIYTHFCHFLTTTLFWFLLRHYISDLILHREMWCVLLGQIVDNCTNFAHASLISWSPKYTFKSTNTIATLLLLLTCSTHTWLRPFNPQQ